jgi:hypothetical protein
MATSIDHSRVDQTDCFEAVRPAHPRRDVPSQITDRIGSLYAEQERQDRIARTELMIRKAEAQLQ